MYINLLIDCVPIANLGSNPTLLTVNFAACRALVTVGCV